MNACFPYKRHNLDVVYLIYMDDFLTLKWPNNIRMCHNERNFLSHQPDKFHNLHNENFLFFDIHHQKDCRFYKSSLQTQYYNFNNFSVKVQCGCKPDTLPLLQHVDLFDGSFLDQTHCGIWHHRDRVCMWKTLNTQGTFSSIYAGSVYNQDSGPWRIWASKSSVKCCIQSLEWAVFKFGSLVYVCSRS